MRHPTRFLALLLTTALTLTACTGDDESDGAAPSGAPTAEPEVESAWTEIALAKKARPNQPRVAVSDSAPGEDGLPLLYAGSTARPGEPAEPTLWRGGRKGLGEAQTLDVPGTDAAATGTATDGSLTVVTGYYWQEGTTTPFAQSSTDRREWQDLEVPDAVVERSLHFGEVTVLGDGTPLALGVDDDDVAAAINLDTGEIIDLPAWKKAKLTAASALIADGARVVALLDAREADGGDAVIAYTSTDGGASWTAQGALPGEEVSVAGVVVTADGFFAGGSRQVATPQQREENPEVVGGTETAATAWTSSDGTTWTATQPPPPEDHRSGWDTWLTAPVVLDGDVIVPHVDEEKLFTTVRRHGSDGRWGTVATLPDWEGPGTDLRLERNGNQLHGVRSGFGHLQTGRLASGTWTATGGPPRLVDPVQWWSSVGLDGNQPVLVGGRQHVVLRGGGSWRRLTRYQRHSVRDTTLQRSAWRPDGAGGLSATTVATAAGSSVVLGARISSGSGETNGSDLVGWHRNKGGKWRSAIGLAGPRTEFLSGLVHTGKEWVAVGADRDSFVGSAHTRGALWTSKDGRRWSRAKGPFDPDTGRDSALVSACPLADGSLLALGSIEDPGTGQAPLAFRRVDGTWRRHDLSGLPQGVTSLDSCASAGDAVIIQGSGPDDDTWRTTDAVEFTPVEIGTTNDTVGDIVAFGDGFAAPGGLYEGTSAQPVLWLSADGSQWHPVAVPVEREMPASDVLVWGDRLLVALTSRSGAGVFTLDNPAEVLESLASE